MSEKIIYLDRNENNYGPAPACFEILRTTGFETLSWYSRDFSRGVKSALSERLAEEYGVPESSVLLGYGGEDLLKQAVHCYLGTGETIMIPTHSWWYYKSIASEKGGVTVEYPMRPGPREYVYDVDALLAQAEAAKPRLILISSPNNPTGNTLAPADLDRILSSIQDTVVVLDEAYWGFTQNRTDYVKDLITRFSNLLIIRTFSKYYALAGLRLGFAFLGEGLSRFSQFSARYLGYNRLSERLGIAALAAKDYYAGIGGKMLEDKEAYYRELGDLPGYKAYRSDANFILADIPPAHAGPLKAYLAQRGLIIKFMNEPLLQNCVRITIGTQAENRAVLDAIRSFVAEKGSR